MKYKKVLVFAAHHDDEVIGAGGSIQKWVQNGSTVDVAFFTNGATGIDQSGNYTKEEITGVRKKESEKVAEILGIDTLYNFEIPCQRVQNDQETFHKAIQLIRKVRPDLVITHAPNDKHRDHRCISQIVGEAVWKAQEDIHPEFGLCHRVRDLWAFEITDMLPRVDIVVDVSKSYTKKMEAMEVYCSQKNVIAGIQNHMEGLSKVRGYMVGVDYGEAFMRLSPMPMQL